MSKKSCFVVHAIVEDEDVLNGIIKILERENYKVLGFKEIKKREWELQLKNNFNNTMWKGRLNHGKAEYGAW
jgi:hypothetical protein